MVWSKLKFTVCTILCRNVLLCANDFFHVQWHSSLYGSSWKHMICANTHSYLRSQGFLHISVWFFPLSSSSCCFSCFLPQHYGCISKFFTISFCIVWSLGDIKCLGSSHGCKVDFISEGEKPGCLVQGAAVMVWWGSSPFFHSSQKDWFCINVFFTPDSWQKEILHFSLSVLLFLFGLSGPVQRGIN